MKKNKEKEVFAAAKEAFIKSIVKQPIKQPVNIIEEEQKELAIQLTSKGSKWDNLAEYMVEGGAERLVQELKNMSGRDFVRNYLKAMEHFKPKLTRTEISPADETDRTINIQIVQRTETGETNVIDVNGNVIKITNNEQ